MGELIFKALLSEKAVILHQISYQIPWLKYKITDTKFNVWIKNTKHEVPQMIAPCLTLSFAWFVRFHLSSRWRKDRYISPQLQNLTWNEKPKADKL